MTSDLLWPFVILLIAHWGADFYFQTHWQAVNKSKRFDALARHVAVYTACMMVPSTILFGGTGIMFAGLNGVLHLITDYFTSRITSKLYATGAIHNFFVVVGLDQLIHQVTLAVTMEMFFG